MFFEPLCRFIVGANANALGARRLALRAMYCKATTHKQFFLHGFLLGSIVGMFANTLPAQNRGVLEHPQGGATALTLTN